MAWTRWRETKRHGRRAYTQWRDKDGKKLSEPANTTDPRRAELHRLAVEQRERARAGLDPVDDRVDLAEDLAPAAALERFLAYLQAVRRKARTLTYYREKLTPIFDAWAEVPMDRWSRSMLEGYLAAHPEWSPRSVQMVVNCARRFIAWAADAGIVCADFVGKLRAPQPGSPESSALQPKQVAALLKKARGLPLEMPIALAVYAALSLGDLRSLTWPEVDLEERTITRRRQKTGTQLRIPIVDELAGILARHRAIGGIVCRDLPKTDSALTRYLRTLQVEAKLPVAPRGQNGWHRLRHTAATMLGHAGVDLRTIGAILGHKPGSPVTLKYLHTDEGQMRKGLEAVARTIREAGS